MSMYKWLKTIESNVDIAEFGRSGIRSVAADLETRLRPTGTRPAYDGIRREFRAVRKVDRSA